MSNPEELFPLEIWSFIIRKCDYLSKINLAKTCKYLAKVILDYEKTYFNIDHNYNFKTFNVLSKYIKFINLTSCKFNFVDFRQFQNLKRLHLEGIPYILSPSSSNYATSPFKLYLPKSVEFVSNRGTQKGNTWVFKKKQEDLKELTQIWTCCKSDANIFFSDKRFSLFDVR